MKQADDPTITNKHFCRANLEPRRSQATKILRRQTGTVRLNTTIRRTQHVKCPRKHVFKSPDNYIHIPMLFYTGPLRTGRPIRSHLHRPYDLNTDDLALIQPAELMLAKLRTHCTPTKNSVVFKSFVFWPELH